ncbi:hypothetical protein LWI29_008153 [Acer saccharum]|uniref:Uncharacterized protein n=1 Tax=Acer saccharum TaxID=4024 RepID=A0AA39RK52_ACESA|nr:hypothetical protein LWI29_008153 [Acer saccharum]
MFFWCCTTSLTFHILAKRCTPIPQALQAQKDHQRDLEIAELRRTVELLQRQLEQQQNNHQQRRNLHEARGEDEDQNPFSVDDDSSDEDHFNPMPLRQTNRRDGDVKVDVPEFNGKMQVGAGVSGNGKDLGNTSADLSKKVKDNGKSGNISKMNSNLANGSRFAVLDEESTEEINVMTTQSRVGKRGKNHSKKVLAEISSRIPGKIQQNTVTNKYLAKIPIKQPSFNKPFKENECEKTITTDKGRKKDKQRIVSETVLDMEEEIEDVEVLQSLHKVNVANATDFEVVAYNLKEAMEIVWLLWLFPVLDNSKFANLSRDVSDEKVKAGIFGPFKFNGVPLRRVNQSYVIGTSTKVNISRVNVEKFDDKYFAKESEEKKSLSQEKKDNQKAIDTPLIKSI